MFAKMTNFYHFRRKTMGGFFGVAAKDDCVFDLFFGIDYHSHLGTRRGGMTGMEIRDLTDPYTISRMLHLEQSSTKICRT